MNKQKAITSVAATLAILWITHFFVDMMIGFWSVYKTMAGVDLAIAGSIAALCPFIGEGMQLYFGSLGDKGYRKGVLLFGIAAVCGDAFLAYSGNTVFLFICYLFTCIGSGAFHPTAVAMSGSLTKDRVGLYVSIMASGGSVGLALSHFIFSNLYSLTPYATFYLAVPAFFLFTFVLTRELPGALKIPANPSRRYGFSAMKQLFRSRELRLLYASQVCIQSVIWGTIFLLPDVLWSKGYDHWICFGAGHFAFVMGGATIAIPSGYLSDRFSARNVLAGAHVIGCTALYSFLLIPQVTPFVILTLLFILGASMGVGNPVAVAFGNKIMPSRPGLVSAFLMGMVWCLSEGIGPGGGGLLTKLFTENAPSNALLIVGGLYFSGIFFTLLLPARIEKEFELETA